MYSQRFNNFFILDNDVEYIKTLNNITPYISGCYLTLNFLTQVIKSYVIIYYYRVITVYVKSKISCKWGMYSEGVNRGICPWGNSCVKGMGRLVEDQTEPLKSYAIIYYHVKSKISCMWGM